MKIRKSVLKKLILEIIESQASDQAKQQGLTSAGFGRYKDKSGKVVAKSQGGQLVKVGGKQPTQQPAKSATPVPTKSEPTSAPAQLATKPDTTDWKNAPIKIAHGEGYSHKYDNEPRPKRMKAIDSSSVGGMYNREDRPVDYGHCQQIFIDKYGKENGEKTYEKLFLDQGTNFGWSLAGKIQKEKRAMISALGLEQPRDLDDVAYYPLWRKWQAKEGIDQIAGQQNKEVPVKEPSVSQKLAKMSKPSTKSVPAKTPEKPKQSEPIPTHADNAAKQRQQSFMDSPEFDHLTNQLKSGKISPERYKSVMTAMMNLKENFRIFKKVLKEKKLEKTSI